MKNLLRIAILAILACSASAAVAQSPPSFDRFHEDPVSFFAGESGQMWVGDIRFMMNDYSDTLRLTLDSTGRGLRINRVLIRKSDSTVVSRGFGTISPDPSGATFQATWNERNFEEATGVMRWDGDQWEISFDGEWKQWFINVRKESATAFTAGLARAVGRFPPVELAQMTYVAISAKN